MGAAAGVVLGIAISVASTVVLIRVLADNDLLQTNQGHIAIGWLILEDIFTVFVLVVLPGMASIWAQSEGDGEGLFITFAWAIVKFAGLILLVVIVGRKVIPRLLNLVARTRSRRTLHTHHPQFGTGDRHRIGSFIRCVNGTGCISRRHCRRTN